MMLGVAYQLGLIPVSAHSIAWAIKDTIRRDHRKNLKAFNIGRKLALEPRALPNKPEPETWEQLVTNKTPHPPQDHAARARTAADGVREARAGRDEADARPARAGRSTTWPLRIYDLMQYEDDAFAKRYIELVRSVYQRDCADRKFAATDAAIWNLAKVMLIKDEPYVAYLLTRYEKKQSATSPSTASTSPTATASSTATTPAPSSTSASTASA